jgi:prepilin-type N-terminal cleavage/methylation domain-containing protein
VIKIYLVRSDNMKKRKFWKNRNKGMSLVELIIAISIMGILAMAISPMVIRYIDKSRKVFDVNTAQTIYEAALLAMASSNDDVLEGWDIVAATPLSRERGKYAWVAYPDGHSVDSKKSISAAEAAQGYYYIDHVAWCRGKVFSGSHATDGENILFKSAYDNTYFNYNGKNVNFGDLQRTYTDEFLSNLIHDAAKGETDTHGSKARRRYDGLSTSQLMFRYTKNAGRGVPECWMLMRREDNGMPEIWIGHKPSGKTVRPDYKIYPDPCKEYTN